MITLNGNQYYHINVHEMTYHISGGKTIPKEDALIDEEQESVPDVEW